MKKYLFLALALALLSSGFVTGCATDVQAYSDPSKTIDIKTDREFVILIALDSNPSTGYSWQATFDETAFELVDQSFEPGEYANENIVGAGGTELLQFKTLKSGNFQITLDYQRPWEDECIDQKVFNVNID